MKKFVVEIQTAGNIKDTFRRKGFEDETKAKEYMVKKVKSLIIETAMNNNMTDEEVSQYKFEIGFNPYDCGDVIADTEGEWAVRIYKI